MEKPTLYTVKKNSESITEAPNALSNTLAKVHVCPLVYLCIPICLIVENCLKLVTY